LTYPRCDVPKEEALRILVDTLSDWEPNIRIGHELHDDEGDHLHGYIRLTRIANIRDERKFDLHYEGRVYHPHIEVARDAKHCYDYCGKGGDFCEHGVPLPPRKATWKEALQQRTKEEFLQAVRDVSPRDYVINHERIEYYAAKQYATHAPNYVPNPDHIWVVPDALQEWVDKLNNPVSFCGFWGFECWSPIAGNQ